MDGQTDDRGIDQVTCEMRTSELDDDVRSSQNVAPKTMNSKGLINNAEIIRAVEKANPICNKNPVEQAKQV